MTPRGTIIVAISRDRAIGVDGQIPWQCPADLRRFMRLTMGGTLIMGRYTFGSLPGGEPGLPGRILRVVTRQEIPGVLCHRSVTEALAASADPVWFCGGRAIYQEALTLGEAIDLTRIPVTVGRTDAVLFPEIDPTRWRSTGCLPLAEDPSVTVEGFTRVGGA